MNANFVYQGFDSATGVERRVRWLTVNNISGQIDVVARMGIQRDHDDEPVIGVEEFEALRAEALTLLTRCESARNQCYIDAVAPRIYALLEQMLWVPPR